MSRLEIAVRLRAALLACPVSNHVGKTYAEERTWCFAEAERMIAMDLERPVPTSRETKL